MQALLRAGLNATFRDSYAPLPYCRIPEFLAASFARNRRFRDFLKFCTLCGCASGERDGEYSESARRTLSINGYPKTKPRSTSGPACCFVFGYRLRLGTPVGPIPAPRPRRAQRWLHRAALGGALRQSPNRPIAHRIRCRRERPEPRRVRRFRFGDRRSAAAKSPAPSAVQAHASALCRV